MKCQTMKQRESDDEQEEVDDEEKAKTESERVRCRWMNFAAHRKVKRALIRQVVTRDVDHDNYRNQLIAFSVIDKFNKSRNNSANDDRFQIDVFVCRASQASWESSENDSTRTSDSSLPKCVSRTTSSRSLTRWDN